LTLRTLVVSSDAADKVVSVGVAGGARFEEVIVASQEIAASTVQLVVASRVKAAPGSANLAELSSASKTVSQATGNVVATAKSCMELIEEKGM
jgi:huntingtin interacting protein 1